MRVNVLGSSSLGNGYVLQNDTEALVIECGVKIDNLYEAVGYNLLKVKGAIVTHEHNDHAGYISQYLNAGIHTLALPEVFTSHNLGDHVFARELHLSTAYKMGNFTIQAFEVSHDVPCVGYLIKHPDLGRMLFATDLCSLPYTFRELNHIMIEANYLESIVDQKVTSGEIEYFVAKRLSRSHMELGKTIEFLLSLDLAKTDNIILIHLSNENSDSKYFVSEVARQTGKHVWEAKSGLVIDLYY